jgi:hypothetical protein
VLGAKVVRVDKVQWVCEHVPTLAAHHVDGFNPVQNSVEFAIEHRLASRLEAFIHSRQKEKNNQRDEKMIFELGIGKEAMFSDVHI